MERDILGIVGEDPLVEERMHVVTASTDFGARLDSEATALVEKGASAVGGVTAERCNGHYVFEVWDVVVLSKKCESSIPIIKD